MRFTEIHLKGTYVIEPDFCEDQRGFFARSFCRQEFQAHRLNPDLRQCSISYNERKGTLRGLHYQVAPYGECKLVRCTMGAIYDVIIDLRPDSPTFCRWCAAELSARNRKMLYVPEGFAHGFQTLQDHTEIFYQMTEYYHPECLRGVRWNDPLFHIPWPLDNPILSEKDKTLSDFNPRSPC